MNLVIAWFSAHVYYHRKISTDPEKDSHVPTILAIDNLVRRPSGNILEVVVSCETGGHNDG